MLSFGKPESTSVAIFDKSKWKSYTITSKGPKWREPYWEICWTSNSSTIKCAGGK